ncbi:MAG TPA: acyl carrier protein [Acidimicrobiales bacterium]|nr:acyl carrier protein [Acidimicrobiales bacterium]
MTNEEVLALIQRELAEIMEIDPATVVPASSFAGDLNADSLALIELVEALETALRIEIPDFYIDDDDLERLVTVGDVVAYIERRAKTG